MYPVLKIMRMLNFLDTFSMGVTSVKSIEKHYYESICAENFVVDAVTPTSDFNITIATCLKKSITSNEQIELPSVLDKSSIVVAERLFAEPNRVTMISMLNDELVELPHQHMCLRRENEFPNFQGRCW